MDRRRLRRIENKFGSDLTCSIELNSKTVFCEIVDFNSLGLRVRFLNDSDLNSLAIEDIRFARVFYGQAEMGRFYAPKTIATTNSPNEIVLVPSARQANPTKMREERANVPELLEPIACGQDPVRLKEMLIMRIENISSGGFRAKFSLSNRHLFEGQRFEGFKIYLPGLGEIISTFRIATIRSTEKFIFAGCKFEDLSEDASNKIKMFHLLCVLSTQQKEDILDERMVPRKVSSILRIRRIDSKDDFREVLRLRFEAYSDANKLNDSATIGDMEDEFDERSIILGAFLGKNLVGTIRIIFSDGRDSFPLEKQFELFSERRSRSDYVEVSKLAISPRVQGSDVLFRLFQSFAIEFMPKRKFALLMATTALAKNYTAIGAKQISEAKPHPVLKGETLAVFVIETKKLQHAKMSSLAWFFFGSDIHRFMSRFGFTKRKYFPIEKYVAFPFEVGARAYRKVLKKLTKRKPKK